MMFERNPVDHRGEVAIVCDLSLADGTHVTGRTYIPSGRPVSKLLEGTDAFIYLETFDSDAVFVPKSDIRGVKIVNTGRPASSKLTLPDAKTFDPYRVLGLEKGASFADIKSAYHTQSKLYHPDCYSGVELPGDVKAYMDAMLRNVNAAFQALKHVGQKSEPIFTRAGR
jgi:hypothetical protein